MSRAVFFNLFQFEEPVENFLSRTWRNLNVPFSTIFSLFTEPRKELVEPLGSAEPRLKNTGLEYPLIQGCHLVFFACRQKV